MNASIDPGLPRPIGPEKALPLFLAFPLFLWGCSGASAPPAPNVTATASQTPPPAAPATVPVLPSATPPSPPVRLETVSEVSLVGADGLILYGTFTPGDPEESAAVLLLHMYGTDRRTWDGFAESLAQVGIASLAIDLRGHGQTGGPEDWHLAGRDVEAAFAWLQGQPGIDPARVGLAGASIGANLALVQSARHPDQVVAAALLSPGLDYFRVKIDGLAAQASGVPLILMAAEDDGYSADSVRALAAESPSNTTAVVFDGSAHGTDLFLAQPESTGRLVSFFAENLIR